MIGVICAMAIEAQSFIERLTDCREEKILNISFWEGAEEKSVVARFPESESLLALPPL